MSNGPRPELLPLEKIARFLLNRLVTHNPLYLLSACFVLHGVSLLLPKAFDPTTRYNPWPLLGLSAGYIMALAVTAIALVRLGRVWDDARSILVIVLGMFVEMSLVLDSPLVQHYESGRWLVCLAYLFAVLVSEALLRGLRLGLPALFRVPCYLMLGLIFLYPLLLVPPLRWGPSIAWRVYLFSPAAALAMLTLLLAVRRGPGYVAANASPWSWPAYPWVLCVVLAAGLALRGYVLSLSFDPVTALPLVEAMQLKSAYGGYFLAPMLLAGAVLLLELGMVSGNGGAQRAALAIPLACVALCFPRAAGMPSTEFLDSFVGWVGSPVRASAMAAGLFYAVAFLRGVRFAEAGLVVTLVLSSLLGRHTVSLATCTAPQPWLLWLLGVFELCHGLRTRDSVRTLTGALAGVAALRCGVLADWQPALREITALHAALAVVLLIGVSFGDRLARVLRGIGAGLLFAACLAALFGPAQRPEVVSPHTIPPYLAVLMSLSLGLACATGDWVFAASLSLSLGACAAVLGRQIYLALRAIPEWRGLRSILAGYAILLAAAIVSAVKAGVLRKLRSDGRRAEGP